MSNNVKIIVATAVVTGLAVAALTIWAQQNSMSILGAKLGPSCPAKLRDYCSNWTTRTSLVSDPVKHIQVDDKFRIRARAWGAEPPIWLKAKGTLKTRWQNRENVKLREIESGGSVDCMVGRLDLNPHGSAHAWHQITVKPRKEPTGQTDANGDPILETILDICLSARTNGDWPNQCMWDDCDNLSSPTSHGGRAHAHN